MFENGRTWWTVVVLGLLLAMTAGAAAADQHEKPKAMEGPEANHYKCYQVLDWTTWDPQLVKLKDQFGASKAKVVVPRYLCNPVDKNDEGIPAPKSHLVCYQIRDDPAGPTSPVKEVGVKNQFGETRLWVGQGEVLCVPSDKYYKPE